MIIVLYQALAKRLQIDFQKERINNLKKMYTLFETKFQLVNGKLVLH